MQNKAKISISKNIITLRKKTGETQLQLAEALGISNRTVSKWENGESEPELQYMKIFHAICSINLKYL